MSDKTLYIKKSDAVYAQVICEDMDLVLALRNHFKFHPEGYQFTPSYKRKFWDGYVRMLAIDGKIYCGLWEEIKKFCETHNNPIKIDPKFAPFNLHLEKFNGWVNSLTIHASGAPIMPYDYQLEATHFALQLRSCILLSPTSSGKSLIQYMLVRTIQQMRKEHCILLVVPNVGLVTQMASDFDDYSSAIEWDSKRMIHGIMAGVTKDTDKPIIISTYQSIANNKHEWFDKFTTVIVDEVHTAVAKSVISIMEKCQQADYRIGLTGTLDDCKTHKMILTGLFGPVHTVRKTHELMTDGQVANLNIGVLLIKHHEDKCKNLRSTLRGPVNPDTKKQAKRKANYQEEIDFICNDIERNQFIIDFTLNLKGNTILMINRIEHGKMLFDWIKKNTTREVYLYMGKTSKDERESIRKIIEHTDGAIIVGSMGVLSTGISIKRLHNMVIAHPSKAKIKVLQSIGRLLRLSDYGNDVTMFDIVDDFRIGSYSNYTIEHGRIRIKYYNDQKFNYSIKEFTL